MNDPQASIHEIGPDTFRISVALPPAIFPGGFTFNQYLVVDDKPLLFHTGPRKLFGLVASQIEKKMPLSLLRYIAFSHVEADECGSLADFLKAAPQAQPVCSQVAAIVSVSDMVDAEPIGMEDGQALELGHHKLRWQSTPHLPHGWECGYLFDETTRNLFCGDLFTQPGTGEAPHGRRHPRSERGVPSSDGLLFACAKRSHLDRQAGATRAAAALLHARQRVVR